MARVPFAEQSNTTWISHPVQQNARIKPVQDLDVSLSIGNKVMQADESCLLQSQVLGESQVLTRTEGELVQDQAEDRTASVVQSDHTATPRQASRSGCLARSPGMKSLRLFNQVDGSGTPHSMESASHCLSSSVARSLVEQPGQGSGSESSVLVQESGEQITFNNQLHLGV